MINLEVYSLDILIQCFVKMFLKKPISNSPFVPNKCLKSHLGVTILYVFLSQFAFITETLMCSMMCAQCQNFEYLSFSCYDGIVSLCCLVKDKFPLAGQ